MRLYTPCPQCATEIIINTRASDRFVLAGKRGEEFQLNCARCGKRISVHVNQVQAEEGKTTRIMAMLVFLVLIAMLLLMVKDYFDKVNIIKGIGILLFPVFLSSLIYTAINQSNRKRVQYFNSKWYG